VDALKSGSWLTRDRVHAVGIVAGLVSATVLLWLLATAHGTLDWKGRPLGTDFSNVWTAGRMALDGRAAEAWNWDAHFAVQRALHHKANVDLFGWHYPPPFLLVAAALATLPYVPALILWQVATLAAFSWLMTRLVPGRETLLLTLAAPVTLICLMHGHNGFLTALLLAGGLMMLERRPFLAGLLLGCLLYKPQFGLIIPILLIAGGHWRAILGACLSAALLVAATLALWGIPVWQAFVESLPLTRHIVIEQGSTGWHKIMSPFAAVRSWGGSVTMAYAVQAVVTLAAAAGTAWLSWRDRYPLLRNAFVCAAVVISTPYVLDYDLVVLLPALAWLWLDGRESGFPDWDATIMAAIWVIPLLARNAAHATLVPLGLMSALAVALLATRRVLVRASPSRRSHATSDR